MKSLFRNIVVAMSALLLPVEGMAQKSDAIDNVARFVPWVATYTLKAAGVENRSNWCELGVSTAFTVAITCSATWALKEIVHKERPDGSDNDSFPSGHTSFAFAGAHTLYKEFGKVSPWIPIGGYAVAAFTAADRVMRDRHDIWDVTAGAALGVLSTELSYWITGRIFGNRPKAAIGVTPTGVSFTMAF